MSILTDIKNTFQLKHNGLNRLILVNVIIFLFVNIADEIFKIAGFPIQLERFLMLPSSTSGFMEHFWTLFTYMFLHKEFFHIFFNMIWLYSIGSIFAEFMGSKRLVAVYVLGGLAGGLLFLLIANVFPNPYMNGPMLRASAGVMAVVVAAAAYSPNLMMNVFLLGTVRLKYIALTAFVLNSLLDMSSNTGGKIAHIGGAAFGLIYALQYRKGNDLTRGLTGILDSLLSFFTPKTKQFVKVAYKRPVSDVVYNDVKVKDQQRVNEILDKISRSGYESLSKEEKDFLFNSSKKM
jgi:membrane associated rhomboid family serine protease